MYFKRGPANSFEHDLAGITSHILGQILVVFILCLPRSATSAISDLPINHAHFNDKNEVILDGAWQVFENYNLIEQGEAVPTFLTRTELDWQALGIVQKYPKGTHISLRYFLKGLPSRKHGYALFARFHLPSLIRIYPLGGKRRSLQARVGFPARDFQSEGYGYGIKMVPFVSEGPDQVWVFEIFQSNYRPLYGGSPEFKVLPGELLERELTSPVFSDIICLGSLLILGLYNFMIYVNFRRDITALTLGLTCFASSLRVVGSSYWLRQTYLYKESWEQVAGVLEYLSIFIAPLFFVLYVANLFPKTLPKNLRNGIVGLFLLACTTILIYFDRPFQYLTYYQLILVVGIIFGVLIPLVRASLLKIPGARFILISSALPLFTIGTDILISQGVLNWSYLTGYSMTLFFLLQSHLVGSRLSESYNRVYALNSELTEGNNKNLALIGELKKLIYPHQVTMITENKSRLEETMPTGKHLAACISFDIQSSSTLGHSENYPFFESVLKRCHRVMMRNYDPHSLNAHARDG
ncbi:7TM-DISM domain-containing protein [Pseudobacteriovorax antillogorgiicola]|uniref:7TM-DISM domain-containing protein n=1 Tax=Pseudobacteriovorax antillogorgiicola TaxID=1513793 RepID=UPI001F323D85|nr:7TM-DISM domain-containing protein [Pseudobacteriovorax antillogorgiicola]